jgi:anaerobic ribonucleoside-triphosphate reductase activating protein
LFDARAGAPTPIESLCAEIERAHETHDIEGITILGGEPLDQLEPLASMCEHVAARGLSVIVFTGHTLAEARGLPGFARLWASLDTLVDGPFDARRPEPTGAAGGRRWIGSVNQSLHHRTTRYADPSAWRGSNHVEVRVGPQGEVSAHGFPHDVRRLLRGLSTR